LILTGRPVDAAEAFQIGLANRVVAEGQALEAAKKLAQQLAAFPQNCLRNDRLSAYQQWDKDLSTALLNEFQLGMKTIDSTETFKGATRFAKGEGRHGKFDEI